MNTPKKSALDQLLHRAAAKLLEQGLHIPPADRDSRSVVGTDSAIIEMAKTMDPLDMPPGDCYRAYARRDGRKRDPDRDGVVINFCGARQGVLRLAPRGVWWFQQPCLVERNWDAESEGRGPMVVTDGRNDQVLTVDDPQELLEIAMRKGFTVSGPHYLPEDEELVLTLARARGIYWD